MPAAWAFSTAQGRPGRGLGVVIAQPDTGVVAHAELDGVVRVGGWDVLDHDPDPTDPLDGLNPGHGTGTASVVVSPESRVVAGSAPAASHMPIRTVTTVVQVTQVAVAEAIGHAVDSGAHVITMSLGGLPAAVLERAVRRAVAADVIVLAAAGNCVRTVVWPARYAECVAVAGTNAADGMWRGTCRGPAVDIAAPGQNVLKAEVASGTAVGQGQGTSYAVALIAGVAALWLAHHGRADLLAAARARGETLQDMFLRLLQATARRPAGWDSGEMGAGIADARALLAADLDAGRARGPPRRSGRPRSRGPPSRPLSPRPPGPRPPMTRTSTGSGTGRNWPPRCSSSSSRHPAAVSRPGRAARRSRSAASSPGPSATSGCATTWGSTTARGSRSRRPPSETGRTEPQAWLHRSLHRTAPGPASTTCRPGARSASDRPGDPASPNGVNPAARPDPADGDRRRRPGRSRAGPAAGSGVPDHTVRARRVPARTREWSQVVG